MHKPPAAYRLAFLDFLRDIRGYSDATVKTYDEAIRDGIDVIDVEESEGVTLLDMMPYRMKIASQHPRTIAKKVSAWRSFVQFIAKQGEAVRLIADDSVKVPKTLPKPVAHAQILEALEQASVNERLVITLLYTLGLRISELRDLRRDAIAAQWVRVTGKGGKTRDVPLPDAAHAAIAVYESQCRPQTFLCECEGRRLSENSLRYFVTCAFARIGLKVTPHQLRHAYATELLNHQARIADVSELLGHASMATTQIYTKLGSALKLQNYQSAHPLCKGE